MLISGCSWRVGSGIASCHRHRAAKSADIAGITAMLAHTLSGRPRRFYRPRGVPVSPSKAMTLRLMLATVEQPLRET